MGIFSGTVKLHVKIKMMPTEAWTRGAERGAFHLHPKEEPRGPREPRVKPEGYLPTWAEPSHLGARTGSRLLSTQLGPSEQGVIARGPLGVPPGAPGMRLGYRRVRLLGSQRDLRPPRWGRREVLRQAVPGGPRCCEKRIPGKPRPAAEGPAARRRGGVRSRGRRLEVHSSRRGGAVSQR